ncbi:MAG: ParB/RepB/Spo0J family partition protein [Kiritimatiellae bacterium]|nr:ParB/RepB/Spo0J family partition protein [Kiritimatiellia bacterium]MCO5067914.1 ParB/RepB/Spo0J family partition protein [Kiritimatiellia bacterium]
MAAKPGGLGRGLGALIKDTPPPAAPETIMPAATPAQAKAASAPAESAGGIARIAISKIRASAWQPRRVFDEAALNELVESVREHGVLQPLLLRRSGSGYELIAGERRFRSAQMAGLKEVPAIVMDVSDRSALELALIENLQRADLNLIEEAEGYRALAEKFNLTQEEIAKRVGKGRSSIANALRLLELPSSIRQLVAEHRLSPGHAKVLLGLEIPAEQELLAAQAVKEDWSVRVLEKTINRLKHGVKRARPRAADIPADHIKYVTDQLHQKLGTAVRLQPCKTLPNGRKAKGTLEIDYYSPDELDRILVILGLSGEL